MEYQEAQLSLRENFLATESVKQMQWYIAQEKWIDEETDSYIHYKEGLHIFHLFSGKGSYLCQKEQHWQSALLIL